MASFSFGFNGDDFDQEENHATEDVVMGDDGSSETTVRPGTHKLQDLVRRVLNSLR
jgi:hypothetical protein